MAECIVLENVQHTGRLTSPLRLLLPSFPDRVYVCTSFVGGKEEALS